MTIFGVSCVGWYDFSTGNVTLNGSNVASVFDQSCSGNTLAQSNAAYQPPLVTADADFNGKNSVNIGANAYSELTSGTNLFDLHLAGGALWYLIVLKQTAGGASQFIGQLSGINFDLASGAPDAYVGSTHATWGSSITGTTKSVVMRLNAAGTVLGVNVSNGTEVTASLGGGTSTELVTCRIGFSGITFTGKVALLAVLNAQPTSGQLAAWESFAQGYGAS
jgi:hypothetical protein